MKQQDKIALLAKTKLNTLKTLIFKDLIDSYINHDDFFSVINVSRNYNQIKE